MLWALALLNVISPCLLLFLPFVVRPGFSILPYVFTLHASFQLTHSVSVIRQIRKSEITMTVVSHSSRSTSLLSKIEIRDCCAWGRIDQYQVCGLSYIGLVNLTHCVLISYAVVGHRLRLPLNVFVCINK